MEIDSSAGGAGAGAGAGEVEAAVAARFEGYVAMGTYVSVDVVGVPQAAAQAAMALQAGGGGGVPVVAFALLRYENRTSVLHFNIQRCVDCIACACACACV